MIHYDLKNILLTLDISVDLVSPDTEDTNSVDETLLFKNWPNDWHTTYEAYFDRKYTSGNENIYQEEEKEPQPDPVTFVYESKEMYATFLKRCMKPCIGTKGYHKFSHGKEHLDDFFTIDDEALCILIIMNSYSKWKDEAEWRKNNVGSESVPKEDSKAFSRTLYTEFQSEFYFYSFENFLTDNEDTI